METNLSKGDMSPQVELETPETAPSTNLEIGKLNEISSEEYIKIQIEKDKKALAKFDDGSDITDKAIAKLKKEVDSLTVSGVDDKEGLKKVEEKYKILKKTRTGIEKIRKELKEDGLKIGRAIDAEAKRLTEIFHPYELKLEAIINEIQDQKDKEKKELELAKEKKVNERINYLLANGMQFKGEYYEVGDVSISVVDVKSMSDETFSALSAKVIETWEALKKEEEQKKEAERLEKLKQSRVMELLKSKFDFDPETGNYFVGTVATVTESTLAELSDDQYSHFLNSGKAEIKRLSDELEAKKAAEEAESKRKADELAEERRKIDEENQRLENEKKALIKQKEDARFKQVANLYLDFNGESFSYRDVSISMVEIKTLSDQDFDMVLSQVTGRLSELKEEDRLADEKAEQDRKDAAAAQAKADHEAKEAKYRAESEAKEAAEQLKKDQAPDREKITSFYDTVIDTINNAPEIKDESIRKEFYGQIERILNFLTIQRKSNFETE